MFFFFTYPGAHLHLHSFPTRRSSDLRPKFITFSQSAFGSVLRAIRHSSRPRIILPELRHCEAPPRRNLRSEEHTSELQSPMYLVCRLLLEKKKKELQ